MLSFTVALALVASMVEARHYPQQQGYGTPLPSRSSYPSHGHGHQQQHYGGSSYDPNSAHIHAPTYPTAEAGWWSYDQQYSTPLIKYEVADLKKPIFSICDPSVTGGDDSVITGSIKISQRPNEAAKLSTDLASWGSDFVDNAIRLDVYEYGVLPNPCVSATSTEDVTDGTTSAGEIFFPLQEVKVGVVNPYADPERGQIKDIPTDFGALLETPIEQDTLLVNLSGPDSIMGRAIIISIVDASRIVKRSDIASTTQTVAGLAGAPSQDVRGCCVITVDIDEELSRPIATEIWHGHAYQQYHHQPYQSNPLNHQHAYNSYGGRYGKQTAPSRYGRY